MAGPIYICDDIYDLVTVPLDGLSLVYHEPSGTTHIVAPPAPDVTMPKKPEAHGYVEPDLPLHRIPTPF